jgi:hypothetical protein
VCPFSSDATASVCEAENVGFRVLVWLNGIVDVLRMTRLHAADHRPRLGVREACVGVDSIVVPGSPALKPIKVGLLTGHQLRP